MLVQVNNAVAVGPPTSSARSGCWRTTARTRPAARRAAARDRHAGDFNPERIQIDDHSSAAPPSVNVGDRFNAPVIGVVDYNFGNFEVLNTQALPSVTTTGLTREVTSLTGGPTS